MVESAWEAMVGRPSEKKMTGDCIGLLLVSMLGVHCSMAIEMAIERCTSSGAIAIDIVQ